jgi:putative iron-dependent peroxidase
VPFGTAEEHGLYFVAYSAQRSRYDRMLARKFGTPATVCATVSPTSRVPRAAYYFAPSLDVLSELAGPDVDR